MQKRKSEGPYCTARWKTTLFRRLGLELGLRLVGLGLGLWLVDIGLVE